MLCGYQILNSTTTDSLYIKHIKKTVLVLNSELFFYLSQFYSNIAFLVFSIANLTGLMKIG